jgi:TorA maturation chaperone TorD
MTIQEKEYFCQLLASLFYPPDQELVKLTHQGTLYSFFEEYIQILGGTKDLLKGFLLKEEPEDLWGDLKFEYARLFSGLSEEFVSLVESFYKPWTRDARCSLSFASEKGLLMGDSAVHLLEIYRQCSLEMSEEFKSCPDHIAMELEFLSYLYQRATDVEIKMFIKDHLDWIPFLREEVERLDAHSFYVSALGALVLFINKERERLEV